MPYKVRKYRGHDLYYVWNPETGQRFSYEPMPRKQAILQMKALYANENIDYDKQILKKKKMGYQRYEPGSDRAKDIMAKARASRKFSKETYPKANSLSSQQ